MLTWSRRFLGLLLVLLLFAPRVSSSAYNARPKLVVVIVVDQLRADYLERWYDKFTPDGFRLLMDKGAYFTDCYYEYVNLHTAPGHATISTGTYTNGHGVLGNAWWNPEQKKRAAVVDDFAEKMVGPSKRAAGSSPRVLTSSTLSDEVKMATGGQARVFGVALKDRSAILPAGRGGTAYWIDDESGAFVTSTYYMKELPEWVQKFNSSDRAGKYWGLEWKDARGIGHKVEKSAEKTRFYDVVGNSPFGNEYTLEFARELIEQEKLGTGATTDVLLVSLSANDILGHEFGPDSPEVEAMTIATDRQLSEFFGYLGRQIGLANLWIALSADHGIAPTLQQSDKLHFNAPRYDEERGRAEVNSVLSAKLTPGKQTNFVLVSYDRVLYLDPQAFTAVKMNRADAEQLVAETVMLPQVNEKMRVAGAWSHSQIAEGRIPHDEFGRKLSHSISNSYGGWYVITVPQDYSLQEGLGTNHAAPWSYDAHVPLGFYGLPFQPGTYRGHAEPIDLAVTLSSLLGINKPTHATGRVLTEAISPTAKR